MEMGWNPGGINMERWNPHGIHMERWNSHGIHVEMGWNLCEKFHMKSTWNPPHSMWNIGGRKSPKWVRSQPKYIPCGMGRIHVE